MPILRLSLTSDDAPRIRRARAEGRTLEEIAAMLGWPCETKYQRKYIVSTIKERCYVDLRGLDQRIGRTHAGTSKTAQRMEPIA